MLFRSCHNLATPRNRAASRTPLFDYREWHHQTGTPRTSNQVVDEPDETSTIDEENSGYSLAKAMSLSVYSNQILSQSTRVDYEAFAAQEQLPRCDSCASDARFRPD